MIDVKMNYRHLGKSGLIVSDISLGSWMTIGGTVGEDDSIKLIHRAFDLGINFFDSAENYSYGGAENILGKALALISRKEVVIATKVSGPWNEHLIKKFGPKKPNMCGHGRKHIRHAVEISLRSLRTDYIDLYQLHWYDQFTPLDETMMTLNDLVREGKILYIGCSNFTDKQIVEAHKICKDRNIEPFISVQPRYNMFDRDFEFNLKNCCFQQGIGAIVYSPLAQGILTGKYSHENSIPKESRAQREPAILQRYLDLEKREISIKLVEFAKKKNLTLAQLAIAWVLRLEEVSSAIIGATSIQQLEENVRASGIKLSQKDIDTIEKILVTENCKQ